MQRLSKRSPILWYNRIDKIGSAFVTSVSIHFLIVTICHHGKGQLKYLCRYGNKGVSSRSNWWEAIGNGTFKLLYHAVCIVIPGRLCGWRGLMSRSLKWRKYRNAAEVLMQYAWCLLIGRNERKICFSLTVVVFYRFYCVAHGDNNDDDNERSEFKRECSLLPLRYE